MCDARVSISDTPPKFYSGIVGHNIFCGGYKKVHSRFHARNVALAFSPANPPLHGCPRFSGTYCDCFQARGIDDRKKLPYFPYRDDGELIYKATEDLVKDYVNL